MSARFFFDISPATPAADLRAVAERVAANLIDADPDLFRQLASDEGYQFTGGGVVWVRLDANPKVVVWTGGTRIDDNDLVDDEGRWVEVPFDAEMLPYLYEITRPGYFSAWDDRVDAEVEGCLVDAFQCDGWIVTDDTTDRTWFINPGRAEFGEYIDTAMAEVAEWQTLQKNRNRF